MTPDEVPLTVIDSWSSSVSSSSGVNVNVPCFDVVSAAMVMLKPGTAAKSTAVSTPLPATLTATVLAVA